jgi:hypothetical protein
MSAGDDGVEGVASRWGKEANLWKRAQVRSRCGGGKAVTTTTTLFDSVLQYHTLSLSLSLSCSLCLI